MTVSLRWRSILIALGGAGLTLIGVIATASTGYLSKGRELDIEMVNVSLSILRGDSKGTESEMARRFALRALERYSGVDIPEVEFDAWVSSGTVPFRPTVLSDGAIKLSEGGGLFTLDPKTYQGILHCFDPEHANEEGCSWAKMPFVAPQITPSTVPDIN